MKIFDIFEKKGKHPNGHLPFILKELKPRKQENYDWSASGSLAWAFEKRSNGVRIEIKLNLSRTSFRALRSLQARTLALQSLRSNPKTLCNNYLSYDSDNLPCRDFPRFAPPSFAPANAKNSNCENHFRFWHFPNGAKVLI